MWKTFIITDEGEWKKRKWKVNTNLSCEKLL